MNSFNINNFLGVFETFLLFKEEGMRYSIIAFDKHLERFKKSSEVLGLAEVLSKDLKKKLLKIGQDKDLRIRLLNYNNEVAIHFDDRPSLPINFMAKVVTLELERELPEFKSTSVLASVTGRKKAEENGAYEALLVDRLGIVREGAWTNFFWMDSKYNWHTTSDRILKGVTRELIFDFFKSSCLPKINILDANINQVQGEIKGCFLTNAVYGMIPVSNFNGLSLEMSEFCLDLSKRFNEYRTIYKELL